MKDQFDRVHDYLRISLTDKCNLACSYCMPKSPCFLPKNELLTEGEILSIAEIFVKELGIRKIRLTGGEPLLRKNAEKIIESLSHLPVELAITTNGVMLDRFFPLFEKIGLRSLNISLDSLISETFKAITKRGYFYKVFKNINQALAKGFHIKINTVVKRGMNDDEILDFVNWTRNSPVHVRFIEFMPFENNQWMWDQVVSYKEILDKIKSSYAVEKLDDRPDSTAKSYQIKGFQGTFAVISSVSVPFCNNCNRIRLTADGKIRNCLFSQNETDLLAAFRTGKDVQALIRNCIAQKHAERGGLGTLDAQGAEKVYALKRPMTAIGG